MDVDDTLRRLRRLSALLRDGGGRTQDEYDAASSELAELFHLLDSRLSLGARPPEAWAEGPDAPELDECTHPTVVMGRCDDCGAYPHGHYGMDPLGGPRRGPTASG